MAVIKVNNDDKVNIYGRLSVDREAVYNEEGEYTGMQITGMLAVHEYIEEITEIETERFLLKNVNVYKESFGSNEYLILYYFIAEDMDIKPDNLDDNIKWLMEEQMIREEMKEKEWYHAYLYNEAIKEVEKLVLEYEGGEKEENENQ